MADLFSGLLVLFDDRLEVLVGYDALSDEDPSEPALHPALRGLGRHDIALVEKHSHRVEPAFEREVARLLLVEDQLQYVGKAELFKRSR